MKIGFIPTLPISHRSRDRELARFFGHQLREFRLALGLSRYALAWKLGFSEAAIRSYERGKRTPCYRFLCALQRTFGVDLNLFLPQEDDDLLRWYDER